MNITEIMLMFVVVVIVFVTVWHAIKKNKEDVRVRVAFCFPDTYEIGMSNLGVRILYDVINKDPDVWCERVYAPWTDMKEKMEE